MLILCPKEKPAGLVTGGRYMLNVTVGGPSVAVPEGVVLTWSFLDLSGTETAWPRGRSAGR